MRGGAIDVVEEMIEINISVTQPGFANTTPLLTACMFNDPGIAEILLQSTEKDLTTAQAQAPYLSCFSCSAQLIC